MRALSVRQPWAGLIERGVKDLEIRSWATQYRGELLICAAQEPDLARMQSLAIFESRTPEQMMDLYPGGVAICVVELGNVRPYLEKDRARSCLVSWKPDLWAWELRVVRKVSRIAIRGALGLFDVQWDETDRTGASEK